MLPEDDPQIAVPPTPTDPVPYVIDGRTLVNPPKLTRNIIGILRHWDATPTEICYAMQLGVRDALLRHKADGTSIVVWDREAMQTLEIPADQIEIPQEMEALVRENARFESDDDPLKRPNITADRPPRPIDS